MKVTCLGAARTVTGSSFLLDVQGLRILVDCGMFQGGKEIQQRNRSFQYPPTSINYVLLTHAHIDHSGLIPRLVREGFKGEIISTKATYELCELMLRDSGHIQESETEWERKRNKKRGKKGFPPSPLYTVADAEASLRFFKTVEYGKSFELSPGIRVRFLDAGHILGSAFIEIWDESCSPPLKVVFSGDIGQRDQMLVSDPTPIKDADFLFMESTYGDRLHKSKETTQKELLLAITEAARNNQKVIIPAFAVERTQELIYVLSRFYHEGLLPEIPIYIDSPLAIAATQVFRNNPEYLNDQTLILLGRGDHPLMLPTLSFVNRSEESKEINNREGAAIIIAGSGMCDAGRIKHHLSNNLWRPGAHIVFVGFQAKGTPGRQIVDGATKIKLMGEEIPVKAQVHTLGGFSAHADQAELLQWLGNFTNPRMKVFVVHGEEGSSLEFVKAVERSFWLTAQAPEWLQVLQLERIAEKISPGKSVPVQIMPNLNRLDTELHKIENKIFNKDGINIRDGEAIREKLKLIGSRINRLLEFAARQEGEDQKKIEERILSAAKDAPGESRS